MTQDVRDLIAEAREACADKLFNRTYEAGLVRRLADALEVSLGERDAATEELEAQLANAKAGWESALRIVNEGNEIIKQVGAERDAAVAAIERVRVRHEKEPVNTNYGGTRDICLECEQSWPCPTIRALDGAPEPEEGDAEYQSGCGSWDCRAPECGRA